MQFKGLGMETSDAIFVSGASGLTGWIGHVVWGTLSDRLGRKFAITFLIIGWVVSLFAMIFIQSLAAAWVILLFWGLFRNAPFPVVYAQIGRASCRESAFISFLDVRLKRVDKENSVLDV